MTKIIEKSCSKCGKNYPSDKIHFRPAKTCKDGLSNVCRNCFKKQIREWKLTKGIVKEAQGSTSRRRLVRFSSEIIRTAKMFRQGIINRSKSHNLLCDKEILNIDYFCELLLNNSKCECCSIELDLSSKKVGKIEYNSPTIDRIIPELGYVANNIAIICWKCNIIKKDASLTELKNLLLWMLSYE